jgi:hypothetical protein
LVRCIALALAVILFPSALADDGLEAGIVTFRSSGGYGEECRSPGVSCVARVTTDGTSRNTTIDVSQRFERAAVSIDMAAARGIVDPYVALPDITFALTLDDVAVHHPVFKTVTETYNKASFDNPYYEYARVEMSSVGWAAHYYAPSLFEPNWSKRSRGIDFTDDGNNMVLYESLHFRGLNRSGNPRG